MAGKVTTIFIEDSSIRLLLAQGKQVLKWASAPLEPGLVKGGVILDEARVAAQTKELFRQLEVSPGQVIAGLSGLDSLYRLITLPELPAAIVPEAVRREAGRVIPASLEEVYLAYQTLPPAPSGETRAFLAAYPRKETDALISTLRQAGLKPTILDLCPLAVCRALNEPKAIVVSARSSCLDIIVMVNRIPEVIRTLSLHGETGSLSGNMEAISEELERTVAFYNSSHRAEPLDSKVPIFVSGDLAEATHLWPALVVRLNCPVSALPSPMEYPEGSPVNEFMVNIGLAFKKLPVGEEGVYYSLVNFNALPEIYLPKRLSLTSILIPVGAVIGIGALVFLGSLAQNATSDTAALRANLTNLESRTGKAIEQAAASRKQIAQVEADIKPLATTEGILQTKLTGLEAGREQTYGDSAEIVKLKGAVLLDAVDYKGGAATISGMAPKETAVSDYARALRSSGRFSSVIISSISSVPPAIAGAKEVVLLPYFPPAYTTITAKIDDVEGRWKLTEEVVTKTAGWKFVILLAK